MEQSKQEQRSALRATARRQRRQYTTEQKLAIVRECQEPGASLAGVAMTHQTNADMVRKGMVKFQRGGFGDAAESGMAWLPVAVQRATAVGVRAKATASTVTLENEMPRGMVRFYGSARCAGRSGGFPLGTPLLLSVRITGAPQIRLFDWLRSTRFG